MSGPTQGIASETVLPVVPRDQGHAVNPTQEAYLRWVVEAQVFPENVPLAFSLRGPLSVECLSGAMDGVVARHDALQASFARTHGGFVQIRSQHLSVPFRVVGLPVGTRPDEIARLSREEFHRPFDLSRGPLIRVLLLRLGPDEHTLLLTFNQLVFDGWSISILLEEIGAIYNALASGKPHDLQAVVSFADIVEWERHRMEQARDYWQRELAGAPFELNTRTAVASVAADDVPEPFLRHHSFDLEANIVDAVQRVASQSGGTLFSAFLAATALLFSRTFRQKEIVLVSPSHGRLRPDSHRVIGLFYRPLFLRLDLSSDPPFAALVKSAFSTVAQGLLHQAYPVAEYAEYMYRTSWFMFDAFPEPLLKLHGIAVESLEVEPSETWFMVFPGHRQDLFCPLNTLVSPSVDSAASVTFTYKPSVLEASTISTLGQEFRHLLARAAAHPSLTVSELVP